MWCSSLKQHVIASYNVHNKNIVLIDRSQMENVHINFAQSRKYRATQWDG